jgi:tRNA threonylcarbamoyl adenosine modification protein (Sua5/YciO/YrdC/YwlC family)
MAIIREINPDYPEPHRLSSVVHAMREGAVVLFPTDSVYAIGVDPHNREALARLHFFKPSASLKPQTMLCPSLTYAARYAHLDDEAFMLMRALTPGPFMFILKATKEVPKLVLNPKRKTAGLRIPDNKICQGLLHGLEGLIISTSAKVPDEHEIYSTYELFDALENQVDLIIDDGRDLSLGHTTVLDLTQTPPEIVREGLGMARLAPFVQ